ncbi:MAG: ADP-glyceromanno-heptose 6-epimerase [Chlamydiales bacterium]|nr:ADP-glyceromanno-heptose 6-epimerase [Chlamydiales bacterium]
MIVLTGGAGFIGSNVLKVLNERGYENIVVVDEFDESDKWKNLVGKSFEEVLDKSELFDWLHEGVQAIIHLGACSSTVERDSHFLLENNYRYTRMLAEYALARGIRFIYASSAATYGDGSKGFSDDHDLLEQYEPLNMYGFSKHIFDLWLKRKGLLDRVVGLKYFNVYGPNEFHKGRMASAILKMVPDVMQDGKIRLFASSEPERFEDGGQIRDFIYVKDAAEMTVQFLENDLGGIFNIGTGEEQTWNRLAKGVIRGVDRPGQIEYIAMPDDLVGKYQNYTCADMKKSHVNKLVMPRFSLEEAVLDYVKGYVLPHKHV